MKRCPECSRTYADETLAFCLADGALLSAPFDPQATLPLSNQRRTNETPTEVFPETAQSRSQFQDQRQSRVIYIVVLVVALFIAGAIVWWLSLGPQRPIVSESATPTPNSVPSPWATPSTTPDKLAMKADASPTPEAKPDLSYLTGVYNLHPLENSSGDPIGTMTLTVRKNSTILARGRDWTGAGRIDGKQGYYDWEFVDGKNGRTTILVNADGTLQGRVFGSGLDWWYLARRRE